MRGTGDPRPAGRGVVLLDFDGVICDSVDECLVTSFHAYYDLQGNPAPASGPVARRESFARLRPFIHIGEDYLLIHELIDRGIEIPGQKEFDTHVQAAGRAKMMRFRELFYSARAEVMARDRNAWLDMNRIYPRARDALRAAAGKPVYILSTKRAQFIHEILSHAGIGLPASQVFYTGDDPKLPLAEKIRSDGGFARAAFVDDQLDHLRGNPFPLVSVYLASWGYVASEEPARQAGVPVLAADELPALVEQTLGGAAFHASGRRVQ